MNNDKVKFTLEVAQKCATRTILKFITNKHLVNEKSIAEFANNGIAFNIKEVEVRTDTKCDLVFVICREKKWNFVCRMNYTFNNNEIYWEAEVTPSAKELGDIDKAIIADLDKFCDGELLNDILIDMQFFARDMNELSKKQPNNNTKKQKKR